MDAAKARLSEVGLAIQGALAAETNADAEIRIARAELLHAVTHAEPVRAPRSTWALVFDPRVLLTFFAPLALTAAFIFWTTRPISFFVKDSAATRVGDLVEAAAKEPLPLKFSEGSSVVLEQGSRARVLAADANGARVLLEAGEAEVSIRHRVGRKARWHVEAGPYRVLVTGTRFHVAWSPAAQAFKLTLREGSVVVSSGRCMQRERVVRAGESVELSCTATNDATAVGASPASTPVSPPAHDFESESFAPAKTIARRSKASDSAAEPLDAFRAPLAAGRFAEAIASAERANFERVAASATQADLLQLADAARLSGRIDRAVQALHAVRRRFSGTSEAAMAAFSLGRIAFDQQGAYSEASRWFSTYLSEQPSGPLMGDAFGRLLEARERAGDHAGAELDAERYLRRFPQGPYAAEARRILGR
jgi:TolA-binding protein